MSEQNRLLLYDVLFQIANKMILKGMNRIH